MSDRAKTKRELIEELISLRKQLSRLSEKASLTVRTG